MPGTGIHETATRIACAMAPALAPKEATTDQVAEACVDLAIAIQAAMSRPITYAPEQHKEIGRWCVDDDGWFDAWMGETLIKTRLPDVGTAIVLVTQAYEQAQRAGVR